MVVVIESKVHGKDVTTQYPMSFATFACRRLYWKLSDTTRIVLVSNNQRGHQLSTMSVNVLNRA